MKRLIPTQKRSRERYELILSVAAGLILDKGIGSLKMSDIVAKAGISHGSLYQYFADRYAVIGTLAERCNLEGRKCVEGELANVSNQKELHTALLSILEGYYDMFLQMPLLMEIWKATQSNQLLQQIEVDEVKFLSTKVADVISKLKPGSNPSNISLASSLIMHLISAAVHHTITLNPIEGRIMIEGYKKIIPKNVSLLFVE